MKGCFRKKNNQSFNRKKIIAIHFASVVQDGGFIISIQLCVELRDKKKKA